MTRPSTRFWQAAGLAAIVAALAAAGVDTEVLNPVIAADELALVAGDDYWSAASKALVWTVADTVVILADDTVTLYLGSLEIDAVLAAGAGSTVTITVELDAAETVELAPGQYVFALVADSTPMGKRTFLAGAATVTQYGAG